MARETELSGKFPSTDKTDGDIRKGFVYRRVPHITLKSIANNEEIDEITASWQEKMEPLRAEINRLLKKNLEECELPREADKAWPEPAPQLLQQWWELRCSRQEEIDASIARHADTELLYDQPYEDNKRIRVAGPFTVESLSPYRVISADQERPATEKGTAGEAGNQFETMILDNLRKAGVQNTKKGERLKFDRLEPYPGECIQAAGEYTDEQGVSRRVAVSIGPENGTVGPDQIKDAAKEAVQGVGFDLLLVCGFAFDPHVSKEVKRYGRLTMLPVRMSMELIMGDAVLKKTEAGNLFMVFGEPDIDLTREKDGKIMVQINGLDIYDPTTGAIRSSTVD